MLFSRSKPSTPHVDIQSYLCCTSILGGNILTSKELQLLRQFLEEKLNSDLQQRVLPLLEELKDEDFSSIKDFLHKHVEEKVASTLQKGMDLCVSNQPNNLHDHQHLM